MLFKTLPVWGEYRHLKNQDIVGKKIEHKTPKIASNISPAAKSNGPIYFRAKQTKFPRSDRFTSTSPNSSSNSRYPKRTNQIV